MARTAISLGACLLHLAAACAFALDTAGWMAALRDDAPLRSIAIPGAHDAGTAGMPWYACTQDADIARQLAEGVRYLDLRTAMQGGVPVIFHGPATGMRLHAALRAVADFLAAHPSECVILDFQHFRDGAEAPAAALLAQLLGARLYSAGGADKQACMDSLPLGSVRGKAMVFWGTVPDSRLQDPRFFLRGNNGGTRPGACLHSFYDEDAHTGDAAAFVQKTLPQYLERFRGMARGLFVLQGQLTDSWGIRGPRFMENTHATRMDSFVASLARSPHLPLVNIIQRDFTTPAKNALTIRLNIPKALVRPGQESALAD